MTKTGIGLFKFPRNNPELMRKWIRVINNIRRRGGSDSFNTEKKETLICEFHFRPSEAVVKAGSSRKSLVGELCRLYSISRMLSSSNLLLSHQRERPSVKLQWIVFQIKRK